MGVFTDLYDRVVSVANSSDVAKVVYDRLDSINEQSKANYPLLLFRVNKSSTEMYRNNRENFNVEIDFYLSDLYFQGDTAEIYEKQDTLDELLNKVIKSIPKESANNSMQLLNTSSAEYGWEQHSEDLFVVKRTVTIQGFKCHTLIDQ